MGLHGAGIVPAGTFDAFRVECASPADSQDTYWVAAGVHPFLKTRSVRGPKSPNGAGTQDTEPARRRRPRRARKSCVGEPARGRFAASHLNPLAARPGQVVNRSSASKPS